MSGWIKLHRKMTEWEWYKDHNTFRLFMHLLLTVNHKDSRFQGHEVPRGSRVSGYTKLSEETGLSVQELRTASFKLKSTGEITVKSTAKFSIITVCNFDKYQERDCFDQQANQQADQQATNRPSTTSKECKKEKNIYAHFEQFWKLYPRKVNKAKALSAWNTKGCGNGKFELVMNALRRHVESCDWKKENGKYIPYPTSWINGERWNDECAENTPIGGEKIGGFTF